MLQTDLIAPIPALLKRQAQSAWWQDRVRGRGGRDHLRRARTTRPRDACRSSAESGVEAGDTVAMLLPNSVAWVESCFATLRAGAVSVPISYEATEPEVAYRLADADCRIVITTHERADLVRRAAGERPLRVHTGRPKAGPGNRRASAICWSLASPKSARSRTDARALVHHLHVRHHRPRQGRAAVAARACCGWRPPAGRRSTASRGRYGALAAAAVPLLRAEPLGAQRAGDRRQRVHHGEVLDRARRCGCSAKGVSPSFPACRRCSTTWCRRARAGTKLPGPPALRFGRRDHAGDAQPGIRGALRRAAARRLRHHRDRHHGDDELADRRARARLVRAAGAGTCGAHRRSGERARCRRGRRRRIDRARPEPDGGLSQQAGRDGGGAAQRLVPHGRSRAQPTRTASSPSRGG